MPSPKTSLKETRERAWVGDAVLSLFARQWILKTHGYTDGQMLARMTSNQFLSALGDPTGVEAKIGELYLTQGYDAATDWMTTNLVPVFERQEANRRPH